MIRDNQERYYKAMQIWQVTRRVSYKQAQAEVAAADPQTLDALIASDVGRAGLRVAALKESVAILQRQLDTANMELAIALHDRAFAK
jgi:uncharacterized protein YqfB (UPF0267 family)